MPTTARNSVFDCLNWLVLWPQRIPQAPRKRPSYLEVRYELETCFSGGGQCCYRMSTASPPASRDVIFISKGTPEDDQFVLWLAPKLESHGYKVFADILSLEPGDRWRKEITNTLQQKAIKMLLCCKDATLAKNGVLEEIEIASDLTKKLGDARFIVPLKLEKHDKIFGIGGLQYIDFENRWAPALVELLKFLQDECVPRDTTNIKINPNWESYRRRLEIKLEDATEPLISNWLRVAELPDTIRYFTPSGAIDVGALELACRELLYPAEYHNRGVLTFCDQGDVTTDFAEVAKLQLAGEWDLFDFLENGSPDPAIAPREAKNMVTSMMRRAWEIHCTKLGLYRYAYSALSGFHVTDQHAPIGKRIQWGTQGARRSSALHNKAKKKLWRYGVTAIPQLWPFPHYRLKARVLFADAEGQNAGKVIDDKKAQHRYRRSICKGWRNKQWYGRLMAFLELLALDSSAITLATGRSSAIEVEAMAMIFTSPVRTVLPDELDDEDEETDEQVLGSPRPEEDDDEVA